MDRYLAAFIGRRRPPGFGRDARTIDRYRSSIGEIVVKSAPTETERAAYYGRPVSRLATDSVGLGPG